MAARVGLRGEPRTTPYESDKIYFQVLVHFMEKVPFPSFPCVSSRTSHLIRLKGNSGGSVDLVIRDPSNLRQTIFSPVYARRAEVGFWATLTFQCFKVNPWWKSLELTVWKHGM